MFYCNWSMFEVCSFTHSTKLSSPRGWLWSTGFRPVTSSKRTTPNEKTSDLSVNFPLDAYSGARYLNTKHVSLDLCDGINKRSSFGVEFVMNQCLPKGPHYPSWNVSLCCIIESSKSKISNLNTQKTIKTGNKSHQLNFIERVIGWI